MAIDITALYCCLDDFCKVFEDWEAHWLIPSQTTRQRTGKLSRLHWRPHGKDGGRSVRNRPYQAADPIRHCRSYNRFTASGAARYQLQCTKPAMIALK